MISIKNIKSSLRKFIAQLYYNSEYYLSVHSGKVLILNYHRVLPAAEVAKQFVQPGMYVLDETFEKHLRFLKTHYRVISFSELLDLWKTEKWNQNQRYCVVTLDDGWLDNYLYAFPLLKKHRIPATIFLATSYIGTPKWHWPDQLTYLLCRYYSNGSGYNDIQNGFRNHIRGWNKYGKWKDINAIIEQFKTVPLKEIDEVIEKMIQVLDLEFPKERMFMNWDEVREMSQSNVSFGSHSSTHRILTMLTAQQIRKELRDSWNEMVERNVNPVPIFCYPNGNYNQEIVRLVMAEGYRAAVSTNFGFESNIPQNLFGLKRVSVHHDISASVPLFTFHISGIARSREDFYGA